MSSDPVQDPYAVYRMQVGAWVRDRLLRTPGTLKIPTSGLDLFVVRDFLDARQCATLVKLIDSDRRPSDILADDEPDPEFRTSESCNLSPRHPVVRAVEDKISQLIGIDPAQGETVQGQRYAVGQQFKPHHDFFFVDQPYWAEQERTGGQRTWTAMIFLNEPEAGGQTGFPNVDVKVTPRTGNLLAWNNMDELGMPNPRSLHTGMPVEAGTKYVITKWYRERPWG
ncbi:prolyl hydroxylase family protein [Sphingosinicella rhizophila]|uniref:2OG-Fe(II) oxygenase n=1 Tax=Sphingosinicella rhizophila TaxID=3050082 RepID=A0ABU3Q8V1_9SPHN|nr:2OG-Fe(II) oxygenase [Sphingosinicella sp. GR2756]MDT9599413.1 2OG-Fe(II) oxygenase [Sphingosinicella sp. GR2756]